MIRSWSREVEIRTGVSGYMIATMSSGRISFWMNWVSGWRTASELPRRVW